MSNTGESSRQAEEPDSIRSRASSIISTGTKTSVRTFAHEEAPGNNADLVREVLRLAARRPASIRSNTTLDQPAPPYHETGNAIDSENFPRQLAPISVPTYHPHIPVSRDGEPEPAMASPQIIGDTTDALFAHYRRIVSTVDQNHQQQLADMRQTITDNDHAYQQELASMRLRINDIDQAYRKEFKACRREVEKARETLATQEAEMQERQQVMVDEFASRKAEMLDQQQIKIGEARNEAATIRAKLELREAEILEERNVLVNKARNEVEDVWETRFKDMIRLKTEEVARLESQTREALRKAFAVRDDQWRAALSQRYPSLFEELQCFAP